MRFDLITNSSVSCVINEALFKQQRRLTNYQHRTQYDHRSRAIRVIAPEPYVLAFVTSLQLYLKNEKDLSSAASVIARTPDITDLSICFCVEWTLERLDSYSSRAELCNAFTEAIFSENDIASQLPRLQSLFLKNFDLGLLGPRLSRSIDFNELKELHLVKGLDVGRMLLSLEMSQVKWERLCIENHELSGVSVELERFLRTMVAPKKLRIGPPKHCFGVDYTRELRWSDFIPHSSCLQSMRFNTAGSGRHIFDDDDKANVADFRSFCRAASNLEQLALSPPPIEEERWQDEHGFSVFLDCLASVTNLKTLELRVFPGCLDRSEVPWCKCGCSSQPTDDMEEFSDATVNGVFEKAANKVFRSLAPSCPLLAALLFRGLEGEHLYEYHFGFIRSVEIDSSGRRVYEAMPVEPHLLKHFEPDSDIVNLENKGLTTNAERRRVQACRHAASGSKNNSDFEGESRKDCETSRLRELAYQCCTARGYLCERERIRVVQKGEGERQSRTRARLRRRAYQTAWVQDCKTANTSASGERMRVHDLGVREQHSETTRL